MYLFRLYLRLVERLRLEQPDEEKVPTYPLS